jgi:hypothetical protein
MMRRAVWIGAGLALALTAVGIAWYALGIRGGRSAQIGPNTPVVLVFASPSADGGPVAQLIAKVEGGTIQDVSPDTSVTIPGASSRLLKDAYVFGGGVTLASVLQTTTGPQMSYVVVPQEIWLASIGASSGVMVDVPRDLSVFDGTRLTVISSGEQRMSGPQLAALLIGLRSLDSTQSAAVRRALEGQLAEALVSARPSSASLETNLSPENFARWLSVYLPAALAAKQN